MHASTFFYAGYVSVGDTQRERRYTRVHVCMGYIFWGGRGCIGGKGGGGRESGERWGGGERGGGRGGGRERASLGTWIKHIRIHLEIIIHVNIAAIYTYTYAYTCISPAAAAKDGSKQLNVDQKAKIDSIPEIEADLATLNKLLQSL